MTKRRELTHEDLERMRIPRRYWGASMEEVSRTEHRDSPHRIVSKYVRDMAWMRENGVGLLLYGPNGLGKTCAAVVIGKEYRRRGATVMFLAAAHIKEAVINRERFDEHQTLMERAKSVDVLLLDDLGKEIEDSTGFGKRTLDDLVRSRAASSKVTFITTNMKPGPQLTEALKNSTMHSLKETIMPVMFEGPDQRERGAEAIRLRFAEV